MGKQKESHELKVRRTMKDKSETKSETKFISTISHKLRTPLNAIIGFSELLLDQVYGELNEKQTHYLKNINSSGKNLLVFLNDLIDLLNLKWGEVRLEYSDFSLSQAINQAQMSVKAFAEQKNVSLEVKDDSNLLTIKADENKFMKILHHLLSNAVKFTPPGGKVEITTRYLKGPEFNPSSLFPTPCVEISVVDNGIGIKPEDQERIFSEFYQVDSTLSQDFEGTGLGLSLAKELVRLHQGKIWVESEEGKGSKFTFVIPLDE